MGDIFQVTVEKFYRMSQFLTISKPLVTMNLTFPAFPGGALRVINVGQSTPLVISGGTRARGITNLTITDQSGQRTNITIRIL